MLFNVSVHTGMYLFVSNIVAAEDRCVMRSGWLSLQTWKSSPSSLSVTQRYERSVAWQRGAQNWTKTHIYVIIMHHSFDLETVARKVNEHEMNIKFAHIIFDLCSLTEFNIARWSETIKSSFLPSNLIADQGERPGPLPFLLTVKGNIFANTFSPSIS